MKPSGGLLVDDVDESIAILRADGQFDRNDAAVLPIYSLTKTFIAAAVAQLGINKQQRLSHWFNESLVPRGSDITLEHLLMHTSGLRDYAMPPSPYLDEVSAAGPAWSDATFAEHTLQQALLFAPGSRFSYANPGYWLLGEILRKETSLSLFEVIQREIAEPLQLTSLRMAQGQFSSHLPDYPAEWVWHGLLLATPGDVSRFMASEFVTALTQTRIAVPGDPPNWRQPHYGYGVMMEPDQCIGHNGEGPGYSASCFRYAEATVCVLLRTSQHATNRASENDQAMLKLREIYQQLET